MLLLIVVKLLRKSGFVESIESYYHRFLKLMNDLKRNKHFPKKIASNLKFLNNLQPEWSRHVTIVHQTKDLHTADYTQLYDFLKYIQKENFLQQPMTNPEDITDPTTAMNMTLALIAKAFKLNYSTPTNNNQRISSNPRNRQIAQPGTYMGQDRQMQMIKVRAEGNAAGHNGNQIRCYNCRGVGHFARDCTVRPRRKDAAYLQTQLLIGQKEEAGIQLQAEEYDLIAATADLDEIEKVNANCILMANLQQASSSAKFFGDFKSLANEADASLAKYKALELEIERLLKAVVSQDIMIIVQNESVVDTSDLQTELEHTSENTKFVKQQIVENLPKVGKTNALSNPVTSNSVSTPQESKSVNNDKVIAPGMFRINPSKTSREEKHVPNTVSASTRTKPITVSQPPVIFKNDVIQICLWCVDSGCSKHMTGNLKLLINFIWKFMGTVRFGNDHVAAILGFGNLQWGNILITRVYFVEGLDHNLFSVGQFYDSDLEVTNDLVAGLPKFKYHKEHLCPSCESKDEAPEVIIKFLKRITVLLQSPVIIIRTDNGIEFKNKMIKEYFDTIGISHQMSSVQTPQQNRAEAIAAACFTQNRSIIHRRFNKTPYELINGRKSDISFLHVFGALCYPKNDRKDIRKLGAKGDIGFFIGYSADSCAYRVYNRRTKKIMKTMNVSFDELFAMAFEQCSSKSGLQSMTSGQISSGLDLTYAPSTFTMQQPSEGELDLLFKAMYDDYFGGQPLATVENVSPAQEPQVRQTSTASTTIADNVPIPTNSSSHATNIPITSQDVDELNPNAMIDGNTFVNPFATLSSNAAKTSSSQNVDPSNMVSQGTSLSFIGSITLSWKPCHGGSSKIEPTWSPVQYSYCKTVLTEPEDHTMALQPHSLSQNSRPLILDHQDKNMMKAQVHVSRSFAISDVQPLPLKKHYCQIYQVVEHMLRRRLLASFQDRKHKGSDTRSQGGTKDNDIKIKIQDHSMQMISQLNSQEQGSMFQERDRALTELQRRLDLAKAEKEGIQLNMKVNAVRHTYYSRRKLMLLRINLLLLVIVTTVETTLKIKTINDDVRLQALIDGKRVVITEASIRHDLKLNDAEEVGDLPNVVQDTPILDAPSSFQPQRKHKPRRKERRKLSMQLEELMVLCTNLSNKVLDLENKVIEMKSSHKANIAELESRVEKLEEKNMSLTKELKSFDTRVESLAFKETVLDKKESSKQGRKITDIDADAEVNLEDVTDADGKEVAEEILEVITTAKIIIDEVSTAGGALNAANEEPISTNPTNITTTQPSEAKKTTVDIPTASKAKGIVFHDMEESTTRTTS
nr:hypothetical protein [Tanacetum cinerariifolium]